MKFTIEIECSDRREMLAMLWAYIMEAFKKPDKEPDVPGVTILGGGGGGPP